MESSLPIDDGSARLRLGLTTCSAIRWSRSGGQSADRVSRIRGQSRCEVSQISGRAVVVNPLTELAGFVVDQEAKHRK